LKLIFEVSDAALSNCLSAGVPATDGRSGARSGRTPEELAREFEPTAQSISTWVKQAERDVGKRHERLLGPSLRIPRRLEGLPFMAAWLFER
jgi:hypothetical protein